MNFFPQNFRFRWRDLVSTAVLGILLVFSSSCAKNPPAATPSATAAPQATLRLATYNVRNYNSIDRHIDGEFKPHWPKPEEEKTALRAVIRAAHPDVLALEEMGGDAELAELQRDLGREGLNYSFSAIVTGPDVDPDRHVALLSRVPLGAVHVHENIPFKLSGAANHVLRGLLEVDFTSNGRPWALYVVHLKSRLSQNAADPQSAAEREGEARAVRDLVRKEQSLDAGALVAVVGDFNDARDSTPLKRFTELDGKPLLKIAPDSDSRGETWTSVYGRADEYDRSDYILLSPSLLALQSKRGVIEDIPETATASDHRLVYVDLALPPDNPKRKN